MEVGRELQALCILMFISRPVTGGADMDTHKCIGFDPVHAHLWA